MKRRVFVIILAMILTIAFSVPCFAESAGTYVYKTTTGTQMKSATIDKCIDNHEWSNINGFWYSPEGGSNVSVTLKFKVFGNIGVRIPVGKKSGNCGVYCGKLKKSKKYKLYVRKTCYFYPTKVERKLRNKKNAKWELYYKGTIKAKDPLIVPYAKEVK